MTYLHRPDFSYILYFITKILAISCVHCLQNDDVIKFDCTATSCLEYNGKYTQIRNRQYKSGKFWQDDGIQLVTKALRNLNHVQYLFVD